MARVLSHRNLDLVGLHCHLGSQATGAAMYGEAIRRLIATMAEIRAQHGVILTHLNIGGGHGVPYLADDPELDLDELARVVDDALDTGCAAEHFPRPRVACTGAYHHSMASNYNMVAGHHWWQSQTAGPANWSAGKLQPTWLARDRG